MCTTAMNTRRQGQGVVAPPAAATPAAAPPAGQPHVAAGAERMLRGMCPSGRWCCMAAWRTLGTTTLHHGTQAQQQLLLLRQQGLGLRVQELAAALPQVQGLLLVLVVGPR